MSSLRLRRVFVMVGAMLAAGCHYFRSAEIPMGTVKHGNLGPQKARGVVVLVPGIGDEPEDFEDGGFVEDVLARGDFDVVAADAHFGYYKNRVLVDRLHADVIAPAKQSGYREIWLVGISLGGLGTLNTLRLHDADVTGAILLAPYMGNPELADEVKRAGGIAAWEPGDVEAIEDAETRSYRRAWQWLRKYHDTKLAGPSMYVGYGRSDRFAEANQIVGDILPDDHVYDAPGGHDWKTWRALFRTLSERAWAQPRKP